MSRNAACLKTSRLNERCIIASLPIIVAIGLFACSTPRSFEDPYDKTEAQEKGYYPQNVQKDVDLLFVVDNSGSMAEHQKNLVANFPKLIEALRTDKLGGHIPNVRIGVVSTDVGIGVMSDVGCTVDGDDGRLQKKVPADMGAEACPLPREPWIAYDTDADQSNIEGCKGDATACVKKAFSCMAKLGTSGCGLEAPLEAARRALDPKAGKNPGFLRAGAYLVVVFITDEDDCSARGPALFQDPGNKTGRLGPLGFRCFAQGFDCGVNDPATVGVRKKCKRRDDYLTSVESFVRFFKGLKTNPEKLIVAAISGPSTTIEVTRTNEGEPYLEPSCKIDVIDDDTGRLAGGAPALRLNALVEALDGQVTPICDKDFGTALKRLGEKIIASLGGQCIRKPLLLKNGGVACQAGVAGCRMPVCGVDERCDETRGRCVDALGNETAKHCGASCLDAADCLVEELRNKGAENEVRVPLERCPREIFVNASLPKDACGTHCPCWRIVPRGEQCQRIGATPFGFEVMRHGDAPPDTVAIAYCRTASFPWESPTVAEAKTHCSAPRF